MKQRPSCHSPSSPPFPFNPLSPLFSLLLYPPSSAAAGSPLPTPHLLLIRSITQAQATATTNTEQHGPQRCPSGCQERD